MYERLFIINDMEYDKTEKINIEENTGITINDVMFHENVVSRIEIEKCKMKYDGMDHLIIGIYMGNLLVGTIISDKDYVLSKDDLTNSYLLCKIQDVCHKL